jgi:hypothetical protein
MHPSATLDTTLIRLRTQHVATFGKARNIIRLGYEGIHVILDECCEVSMPSGP